MDHPPTIERRAARAILIAQQKILLIHTYIPDSDKLIWLCPGGGVEADETYEQCLYREVFEETGLRIQQHSGLAWQRAPTFQLRGKRYRQEERYFIVPCSAFEPTTQYNPAAEEADIFRGFKWWSVAEIQSATTEIFVPLKLANYLAQIVDQGCPINPIDVGL